MLRAPLSGWVADVAEVPDPVFAQRMMGDGVAIDPLDPVLVAPCDGTVLLLAPTSHSVTLRATNGAEILMHIGLETVSLKGRGFTAHVAAGQSVRQGDKLISFDLDVVAAGATSLITPIVVTNCEAFTFAAIALDRLIECGEPIGEVRAAAESVRMPYATGDQHKAAELAVPLVNGIHARPAARIAACAKRHSADIALHANGRQANARSPVSMMALGVRMGDILRIEANGDDAAMAIQAVTALIESGMGETAVVARPAGISLPSETVEPATSPGELAGVCAVAGLAMGPAVHLRVRDQQVEEEGTGIAAEREALAEALSEVAKRLSQAMGKPDTATSPVAAAHLALIEDFDLLAAAEVRIADGKSAGFAWRDALRYFAEKLRSTGSALLKERIDDLADLERQVLSVLSGDVAAAPMALPAGAILLADELLPSQLMNLDLSRLAGLCMAGGGPTSHVAIIAGSAAVPTVVAAGPGVARVPEGATVLLDATRGRLVVEPDPALRRSAAEQISASRERRQVELATAFAECRTLDGVRIEVFANLASISESTQAVAAGAEGCGLLRTEFLFLDRQTAPDEAEQLAAYQAIADALGDRPLIIRTMDIGGDKPAPYLGIPREDNPALGLRGVRTSLWRPDLLDEQLRAILRVRPRGRCKIMAPMVGSIAELRAMRARLDAMREALSETARVELGIMIETPAAAILADQLAAEADFFSVGSNDLTQYALAMDRGNPLLAAQVDGFHPAVLRLIKSAVRGAAAHGRPVGVCGGIASETSGAVLLVGLGVTELSVTPSAVPAVKAAVRAMTLHQCRSLADRALAMNSADAVRALAGEALAPQSSKGAA